MNSNLSTVSFLTILETKHSMYYDIGAIVTNNSWLRVWDANKLVEHPCIIRNETDAATGIFLDEI